MLRNKVAPLSICLIIFLAGCAPVYAVPSPTLVSLATATVATTTETPTPTETATLVAPTAETTFAPVVISTNPDNPICTIDGKPVSYDAYQNGTMANQERLNAVPFIGDTSKSKWSILSSNNKNDPVFVGPTRLASVCQLSGGFLDSPNQKLIVAGFQVPNKDNTPDKPSFSFIHLVFTPSDFKQSMALYKDGGQISIFNGYGSEWDVQFEKIGYHWANKLAELDGGDAQYRSDVNLNLLTNNTISLDVEKKLYYGVVH
jgi:hypothetical protein